MMSPRCASGARIWEPMRTCCFTCSNSSGVSGPCLLSTASRVPIFPMSCSRPATRTVSTASSDSPNWCAIVAERSATIAHQLGLSDEAVETVRVAGRLHDIGKIGTREAVLNKQGPLTPEEFEHVKQHVLIGSQILAPLAHLGDIIPAVRGHHERWDGTGYPDGLRGEDIPLAARIIGVAEVFDALNTSRSYQEKMNAEQAVERMTDLAGTVLDPKVFEALTTVVARRRTLVFLDEGGVGTD